MIDPGGNMAITFNKYRFFALDNTYVFDDNEVFANGIFRFAKNDQDRRGLPVL